MLSIDEIYEQCLKESNDNGCFSCKTVAIHAATIYRNQGIEQAAKLCCIHMTDGFSICSESAVLALKEEV